MKQFVRTAMSGLIFMILIGGIFATGTPENSQSAVKRQIAPGPFGKYDPPIVITTAINHGSATYPKGMDVDDNVWTRGYMEKLGIDVEYRWVASTADEYEQKLNVNIASGDIPDLFSVGPEMLDQLAQSGLLADLRPTYDEYAMDLIKSALEMNPITLAASTMNGKLVGLPSPAASALRLLWVRTDWTENLGLEYPETWNDVMAMMTAFVNKDPDGNGKNDTLGFPVRKELWGWPMYLDSFFNVYGAYPNTWIDVDGKIAYGSVQPEAKEALAELQKLYAEGFIDQEFAVKGNSAVFQDISDNRYGIVFQGSSGPARFRDLKKNIPESDWKPLLIPAAAGGLAKTENNLAPATFWVVRNDYANPEALWKLANFRMLQLNTTDGEIAYHTFDNVQTHLLGIRIIIDNPAVRGHGGTYKVVWLDRLSKGRTDKEGLTPDFAQYIDNILAVQSGNYTDHHGGVAAQRFRQFRQELV